MPRASGAGVHLPRSETARGANAVVKIEHAPIICQTRPGAGARGPARQKIQQYGVPSRCLPECRGLKTPMRGDSEASLIVLEVHPELGMNLYRGCTRRWLVRPAEARCSSGGVWGMAEENPT